MVTLISPYYDGDTHAISNDSPASTNTSAGDDNLYLGKVLTKLIQIVLWARLGTDSCHCENTHHSLIGGTQCYLTDPLSSNLGDSEYELKLQIIHKDTLLECWTFCFIPSSSPTSANKCSKRNSSSSIILLIQSIYSHIRLLPVESLLNQLVIRNTDLDFLLTTTNTIEPSQGCRSSFANGSQTTLFDTVVGFRPLASVATHSFPAVDCIDIEGQLSLQVMYDETIDKAIFVPEPAQVAYLPLSIPPTQKATCLTDTDIVIPASKENPNVELTPLSFTQQNIPTSITSRYQWQFTPTTPAKSYVGARRLSRLSLSALNDEKDSNSLPSGNLRYDHRPPPPLVMPLSTSPIQYTHHGHTLAYSTSSSSNYQQQQQQQQHRRLSLPYYHQPHHHGLVGSYEESLLSGRMSTLRQSKPISFHADIGVLGHGRVKSSLRLPPHRSIVFPAYFYNGQETCNNNDSGRVDDTSSAIPPYVGTIDLTVNDTGVRSKGYRIPSQGQLQITIKNPHNSLVKLFLVPYDVSSMPPGMKTFLRQKSYARTRQRSKSSTSAAEPPPKQNTMTARSSSSTSTAPKYIIHLQICRTNKNRVYLYNKIRVVFVNRCLNPSESLFVVYDGPKAPVYSPLSS